MQKILEAINRFVWGAPALISILSVGILLSFHTGFAQITLFPKALKNFFSQFRKKDGGNGTSAYRALCTALAATVGTGNIVGVAGAISIGGAGAIFWMWIGALLGMATKFAEATLAVRYRRINANGEAVGGPMYIIESGMGGKWRWLAGIYCFFGVVASFGVGNATQINAMIVGISDALTTVNIAVPAYFHLAVGILCAILVGFLLFGGAKRIGAIAEQLVPIGSVFYLLLCIGVLILRADRIPDALSSIVRCAFSPKAVTGGAIGSAFTALRVGTSRGVFTNEAGIGTAAIAHGQADVVHPAQQGLMGIMEVFLDTVVICTMTALVILCSGVPIPYGTDAGGTLTTQAFSGIYGAGIAIPIAACLCCFAFATVLGWGLYGARCAQYLFGENAWKRFALLQTATVIIGAVLKTQTVWMLAETVNGLMAIPNLIALAVLSPEVARLTYEFRKKKK